MTHREWSKPPPKVYVDCDERHSNYIHYLKQEFEKLLKEILKLRAEVARLRLKNGERT